MWVYVYNMHATPHVRYFIEYIVEIISNSKHYTAIELQLIEITKITYKLVPINLLDILLI